MAELAVERHWAEAFAAGAAARAGEPAWLEATRKAAIARFAELGVPTRRHEEWKYTNADRIARVAWRPAAAAPGAGALDALDPALRALPRLVFVNGRFAPALTRLEGLPAGALACAASALWPREGAWLEPLLALPAALADRAFAALGAAMAPEAAVVRVGRDVALDAPLVVAFLSAPGADTAVATRLAVLAEGGARLALIEVHAGPAGAERQLHDALCEVVVGANASVDHVRLQLDGAGAIHLGHGHARVERDGRYASRSVALGAAVSRLELVATLAGEGAEATLDGLYVATDGQHSDNRTTVDHARPHGTSRELYKGVLAGRSRGVFNGKVIVRKDAQKTSADQKNQNLLLTAEAEADSKPQLEIEADDVRCSHGSTIGQLEEEALFYLRARGLDAAAARALLVRAFVGEVLAGVPDEALRASLLAGVLAKLGGVGVGAEASP